MVFSNVARRLVRTTLVGRNVKVPYIGCSDHGAASRTLCVGAAESKSPASILIAQDRITFIVECSFQHGMPVCCHSSLVALSPFGSCSTPQSACFSETACLRSAK